MVTNTSYQSSSASQPKRARILGNFFKPPIRYYIVGFGLMLLALLISSTFPQNSKVIGDSPTPTQQLLEEVRLLRRTLEHSQATVPAFQLLLERSRFQSESVNQLSQRASDARLSFERARIEEEQMAQRIEELKKQQQQTSDLELRTNYENQLKEFQLQEIQQKKLEEFYRQEQDRLIPHLAEEQSKLDELNTQLNKLQAELSATSRRSNN